MQSVAPIGKRKFDQSTAWTAAGKVIIINGVTRGHHCRSFQSAQKSQSPTVSAT